MRAQVIWATGSRAWTTSVWMAPPPLSNEVSGAKNSTVMTTPGNFTFIIEFFFMSQIHQPYITVEPEAETTSTQGISDKSTSTLIKILSRKSPEKRSFNMVDGVGYHIYYLVILLIAHFLYHYLFKQSEAGIMAILTVCNNAVGGGTLIHLF